METININTNTTNNNSDNEEAKQQQKACKALSEICEETADELVRKNLQELTLPQLAKMCCERGVRSSGKKELLIELLLDPRSSRAQRALERQRTYDAKQKAERRNSPSHPYKRPRPRQGGYRKPLKQVPSDPDATDPDATESDTMDETEEEGYNEWQELKIAPAVVFNAPTTPVVFFPVLLPTFEQIALQGWQVTMTIKVEPIDGHGVPLGAQAQARTVTLLN